MAYRVANLLIDQGATYTATVNLVDPESNAAINIAGYSMLGALREYFTSSNSASINVFSTNTAAGEITLSLDANTSANLVSGVYVYDVLLIDTSNNVIRILEGEATINPQTTTNPWQTSTLG